MALNEAEVEQIIQERGLTAPRITPADIDNQIVAGAYHVFPGTTTTVCCLTLRNGFTVVGESACADPRNFNEELGRKIAHDNARNKIWALEGYRLRAQLHEMTYVGVAGSVRTGDLSNPLTVGVGFDTVAPNGDLSVTVPSDAALRSPR